jgi:hypothetical protein
MRAVLTFAILISLCSQTAALAYKPAYPKTFTITTPNQKFLFVMYFEYDDWKSRDKDLFADYPATGLYKNDGSKELLWRFDSFKFEWELDLASDGVHLVRFGPGLRGIDKENLKREAVSFFANGKLLRTYSVGDLIKRPKELLPEWTSSAPFSWVKKSKFDEDNFQYSIITNDGEQVVFDIQTGQIISQRTIFLRNLNDRQFSAVVAGGIAFAAIFCWWLATAVVRLKHRNAHALLTPASESATSHSPPNP